jgi:hypothetical protein
MVESYSVQAWDSRSYPRANHRLTLDLWLAKDNRFLNPKSSYKRILMAPPCRLILKWEPADHGALCHHPFGSGLDHERVYPQDPAVSLSHCLEGSWGSYTRSLDHSWLTSSSPSLWLDLEDGWRCPPARNGQWKGWMVFPSSRNTWLRHTLYLSHLPTLLVIQAFWFPQEIAWMKELEDVRQDDYSVQALLTLHFFHEVFTRVNLGRFIVGVPPCKLWRLIEIYQSRFLRRRVY